MCLCKGSGCGLFIFMLNIPYLEKIKWMNPLETVSLYIRVCVGICESVRRCLEYVTHVMFNLTGRKNCSILDKLQWKCLSNDLPNPQMSRPIVCQ